MYCQNFAGSWGLNLVDIWFVALQCKTIDCFVKHLRGPKYVDKGIP